MYYEKRNDIFTKKKKKKRKGNDIPVSLGYSTFCFINRN